MADLLSQIQAFTLTLVLGVVTGVIFHYYQLFIRQARVGRYSLYILDMVLWLFIITLVFWAMICINQGEVRFYILLALLSGIFIYFRTLSGRLDAKLADLAGRNVKVVVLAKKQLAWVGAKIKAIIARITIRRNPPGPDPE